MSALMGALDQDGPALLDRALQTRVNLPKVPTRSLPKACADPRAPVSSSAPRPMVTRPQANAVSSARSPIAHRGVLINASGLLTSHNSTGWPEPLIIPALQPHWGPGRRRQRAKRANLLGIAETKPPALRWCDNQGANEPDAEWARRDAPQRDQLRTRAPPPRHRHLASNLRRLIKTSGPLTLLNSTGWPQTLIIR